jgi:SAM-dependent methyltransferase
MNTPLPPPEMRIRVSGNDDAEEYQAVGARAAAKLLEAVNAHAAVPVNDLLDWGCGPGRVAAQIDRSKVNLYGCDVYADAITWCSENIEEGFFKVSPLYPPLPYEDSSFDAVLAVSVMTHLSRKNQLLWLRDLARVLRPGGILVASVHGATAARAFGVPLPTGIYDEYLGLGMTGIIPDGYYRDVLQSENYTRAVWTQYFEVVAYEEAGLESHDLVTLRSRKI